MDEKELKVGDIVDDCVELSEETMTELSNGKGEDEDE